MLQQLLARQAEDATALLFLGLAHAMDGAIEPAVQAWRGVHDYSRILVQGELNLLLLLADGGGLYLLVKSNGSKHWRLKYRFLGKEKLLALGP